MMTAQLIELAVKTSLVLAAAAATNLVLHHRASAAAKHLIWTAAIVALLLLPMLSATLSSWNIPVRVASQPVSDARIDHAPVTSTDAALWREPFSEPVGSAWPLALLTVYVGGVLLLLARLATEHWIARRIVGRATKVNDPEWTTLVRECIDSLGIHRSVDLLRTCEHIVPMALGIRAPAVLVPALADSWDADRRRAVLLHELAHIDRHDCFTQFLAELTRALYWVHPGVWWVARRLRIEREAACDDRVITAGAHPHDYAGHLLELAYTCGGAQAPAVAIGIVRSRHVEERLRAILDAARSRTAPARRARLAGLLIAAAVLLSIGAAHAAVVGVFPTANALPTTALDGGAPAAQTDTAGHDRQTDASDVPQVSQEYIRELSREGFTGLGHDDLVRAREHGIRGTYIREMRELGYGRLSLPDLVRAREHGISPEYVRDLQHLGYTSLALDVLVDARNHGISPEYIRELRELGYRFTLAELTRARDHGVTPEFIRDFHAAGYEQLSLDDVVRLRKHGISAEYARQLKSTRSTPPTIDELVRLHDMGSNILGPHLRKMGLYDWYRAFVARWLN